MDRFVASREAGHQLRPGKGNPGSDRFGPDEKELNYVRHYAIKCFTDTEVFQFNTAIARIMELINAL